jgi:hypothetical protein
LKKIVFTFLFLGVGLASMFFLLRKNIQLALSPEWIIKLDILNDRQKPLSAVQITAKGRSVVQPWNKMLGLDLTRWKQQGTTDKDGRFTVKGRAQVIHIEISSEGFETATLTLRREGVHEDDLIQNKTVVMNPVF